MQLENEERGIWGWGGGCRTLTFALYMTILSNYTYVYNITHAMVTE